MGSQRLQHWVHWLLTLTLVVIIGVWLLPYLRSQPESIHAFFNGLARWQRNACVFLLCLAFAFTMFNVLSPRLRHLQHIFTHPPRWLAWILGIVFLGVLDLTLRLSPQGYVASLWDWLEYAGVPIILVCAYRWLTPPQSDSFGKIRLKSSASPVSSGVDWKTLEAWLASDAPAEFDFLENYSVAKRLKALLDAGTRSIGLVGPFGSGKSSVVEWVGSLADSNKATQPMLIFSRHSCWGFDTSASANHRMLTGGIAKVAAFIDTFDIRSLPDSYRQSFSLVGEWLDKTFKVVVKQREPIEQFSVLSACLREINARLVFVVEDLDRTDSRTFDIQEVLGLLQQLKEFDNLSFILTGGLTARRRIDYSKLCDHIEYLKPIDFVDASRMVCLVRERCLNRAEFPHEILTSPDDNEWKAERWVLLIDRDRIWPPEAVARLLNTPRAVRYALGSTYRAWKSLFGEVDWDHLLAINVLRYAAPEAFSFVLRNWGRIKDRPANDERNAEQIRHRLQDDWQSSVRDVDWDARAALALVNVILPVSSTWMGGDELNRDERLQGVHLERYWLRAINEVCDHNDRDQVVARDILKWCDSPASDSELVTRLCTSGSYSEVWEHLAPWYWKMPIREMSAPSPQAISNAGRYLLLCEQVLSRICKEHGSAASMESQGFLSVWRRATHCVPRTESNRSWLEARITEAMSLSLALVNDLFHYWCSARYWILTDENRNEVRRHVLRLSKQILTDPAHLCKVIHPTRHYTIYQLIAAPGIDDKPTVHSDVESWKWFAPVVLEALKSGSKAMASEVCCLLAADQGGTETKASVNTRILFEFFEGIASQVLDELARIEPTIDGEDCKSLSNMIQSARNMLCTTCPGFGQR